MRHFTAFCLLLTLMPLASARAQDRRGLSVRSNSPERRTALVIGNNAYEAAPLKNPVNDARDMSKTLMAMGFEVTHREDVTQRDMKRAIREFGAKIRGGGVGLFYYAGHGVQVKGVNYLVPVDAQVQSEEEVEYEGLDVGFVLAQMESAGNSMNIMILDACRNNPFARSFRSASNGLAQMDAPSGTLIAYATAPGSVAADGAGKNGTYTQELLRFMRVPDLSIEEVLKRVRISVRALSRGRQTPWESSSLTGDFYFSRGDAGGNPPASEPAAGEAEAAAKAPDDGAVEGSTYANRFFGFRLTFPASWTVQSRQAMNMMSATGKQMAASGDKGVEAAIDAASQNSFYLLSLSKHPLGSPVDFNPMFMSIAERVSHLPGVRRGSDYFFGVRRLYGMSQVQHQFGQTSTDNVGGVEFDVMPATITYGPVKVKQKFYAAVRDGFILGFILSYNSDAEGRELDAMLRTTKFQ